MEHAVESYLYFLRTIPSMEHLAGYLSEISTETDKVSFLCYDIYSLRKINRAYGRKVGDALLSAVAAWSLGCFPEGKLYRIEGDQFCVVFRDMDMHRVYLNACSLENRFGRAWHLATGGKAHDIYVRASIAVLGDLDCDYPSELPDLLEQALEISRTDQQITVFNAEYDKLTREHVRLQMELKNCIYSNMAGFNVHYQPLADPVSGTWRGLEALCRWCGPTIGPVPPNIFIEEAEKMGLISQVGAWVLGTALETCKRLGLDEIDRFFVAVNVSALQMNRHNFVQTVVDTLKRYRFPPDKLLLEITESTQFSFNEMTSAAIEKLRGMGVMFGLDDFGSGYSGFSNLKNLPVDILKTDREFIENIENDSYLQYFYYIMSETAHANNMLLVAEGIETQEQLQSVVKNGADIVQGYLLGRPMDSRALEACLDNFSLPLEEFTGWMTSLADFKHWINSQDAYMITPALFGLQSRCINTILDEEHLDHAMDKILEIVGVHFKVNRVYVFLQDEGTIFSNQYEWCAEDTAAQKHLFQRVDGSRDGFYDVLRDNDLVIASNPGQLPQNLRERLERGNQAGSVKSMVAMPMKRRGEILGFVGYDQATERDWMPEELIILHNLCLLCLIILVKTDHILTLTA